MKLYAPKYYKNFKCIADKCEHSCCVGWEIDVDENTLKKYQKLKSGYGLAINDSISMDDAPHFTLCSDERCPHLDENGLCKIIINYGEDYLSDICRLHPRFFNYTSTAEVGLGMSCQEAAKIILSSNDYAQMDEVGDVDAEVYDLDFDGREERSKIYDILQSASKDYKTKLNEIYSSYDISVADDSEYIEILSSLEYLDPSHKPLFANYSSDCRSDGADEYMERFLAYLIYRHCTEANDIEDFSDRLSFCLFLERLLASLICIEQAKDLHTISKLASIISEEIEYSDDNTDALIW